MEIRRDPITQSWVVQGQKESLEDLPQKCPFDRPESEGKAILLSPAEGVAQVRVLPHPDPLYRIEGQPGRLAEGIYDKMGPTGAHEVVVETPQHDRRFSQFSDDEIDRVLTVWASRIADLKKDVRFKYISVFKNQGLEAGEEWSHAHSQVTATIFVPRRIKYELNAAHEWYKERERCIFCDMVRQEEKKGTRIVDVQGEYYALCPYASRVPYEIWLLHRKHNHLFEQPHSGSNRKNFAALLRTGAAPPGKALSGISPGRSHRAKHAKQKRGIGRLLENPIGRFSLAHRDIADRRETQQVLQHKRGVLQRGISGASRRASAFAGPQFMTRAFQTARSQLAAWRHSKQSDQPAFPDRFLFRTLCCPAPAASAGRRILGRRGSSPTVGRASAPRRR